MPRANASRANARAETAIGNLFADVEGDGTLDALAPTGKGSNAVNERGNERKITTTTTTTTHANASMGRTCKECGTARTSKWRKPLSGGFGDGERVCKACFQKQRRKECASGASGRRCACCGETRSRGEWVKAKRELCDAREDVLVEGDVWCTKCHLKKKAKKLEKVGAEKTCPKCDTSRVGLKLVKNPDAKEVATLPKICTICYAKARYRDKYAKRKCAQCKTKNIDRGEKWHHLPPEENDEKIDKWACPNCHYARKKLEWRAAKIGQIQASVAFGAASTGKSNGVIGHCDICGHDKPSGQWRKIDGGSACSACYQRRWRNEAREELDNAGESNTGERLVSV